ncbi:MAG: thiol:disulfide interchange protein DsbA/DsbL [Gammaproteobacteria bacterium]|nr:thiol:disulfide interchange protein DsbA/DsbL [Gammaproteobacteria bacterium]MDH5628939.1 thiol:disulfide interchange protein DsbA/DsbL [Gammaproteobacteria bacterium]
MRILKIVFTLVVTLSSAWINAADEYLEGVHYRIIGPELDNKPMVEEFFNYGCGACYNYESFVAKLKSKTPGLEFKLIPVELNPSWSVYVKAYLVAEKMGILDKTHDKLFHRIHVKRNYLNSDDELKQFFLEAGANEKEFDDLIKSYWLKTQMRVAKQTALKSKVTSTPTFVVNKRYLLLNQGFKSIEEMEKAIINLSGINKK